MFDIGGWEFLLIIVLGLIIIGPKELPGAIRTVNMFVRRARELAHDFQSGLEEVAREAELDKVTEEFKGLSDPGSAVGNLRNEIENTIDPDSEMRKAVQFDPDWTDDDLTDFSDATPEDGNRIAPGGPSTSDAPPDRTAADEPSGGDGDTDDKAGEGQASRPRAAS